MNTSHLYYFGKEEHVTSMQNEGIISCGLAQGFTSSSLTDAQRDEETKRTFDLEKASIFVSDNQNSSPRELRNIQTASISLGLKFNYYCKSFACEFKERLYDDFPGGYCLKINDPEELFARFKKEFEINYPDWRGFANKVTYLDFSKLPREYTQVELLFIKDSKDYSDQGEYRFALIPPIERKLTDRVNITLGSIEDISEILQKKI